MESRQLVVRLQRRCSTIQPYLLIFERRRAEHEGFRRRRQVGQAHARGLKDQEPPTLLTVSEVASLLRTTPKGIYAMTERGFLPGVTRIGRRLLVRSSDLLDWLRQKSAPSPKE